MPFWHPDAIRIWDRLLARGFPQSYVDAIEERYRRGEYIPKPA